MVQAVMVNNGFARVVVRNAAETLANTLPSRSLQAAVTQLEKRASATLASSTATIHVRSGSGLTPIEVGLTLAVLLGLFVLLVIVGELCKVFNKPRKEAAPYVKQKPYQPSAAGYGTRAASHRTPQPATKNYGMRASLLASASPMGYVTNGGDDTTADTSLETPSNGSHGGNDYFGRKTSSGNGHSRGQSSGVQLPGATILSSRKMGAAHPTTNESERLNGVAPDGSGFKPGKPVNYNGYAGPMPNVPRGPGGAPANIPSHARVGMGRPPALDARRRSRYSRATSRRIDSLGPGQLRKSLYMGADDDPMNADNYGANGPVADRRSRIVRKTSYDERPEGVRGAGLRRVDSVGKGDARRKSQVQSTQRASRAISIYNNGGRSEKSANPYMQPSAVRVDPLGAESREHLLNAVNGPNQGLLMPNDRTSPNTRSRSGSGSSRGAGSSSDMPYSMMPRSPASSVSPLPSPGLPQIGKVFHQGMPGSGPSSPAGDFRPGALMPSSMVNGQPPMSPQFSQAPTSYPGGGAPRIRPNNPGLAAYNAPVQAAGGYDRNFDHRSARQIV